MKDSLFALLIHFFERRNASSEKCDTLPAPTEAADKVMQQTHFLEGYERKNLIVRRIEKDSLRVFTAEERLRFTRASQQFILRFVRMEIIAVDLMEQIINLLTFSDSPFITLAETKWAIRHVLSEHLNTSELAFLDMVLYQKEHELPVH